MQAQAESMVCDPILWVIVGPNFLTAISASNHGSSLFGNFALLLLKRFFVESGAQNLHRLGFVLYLRLFILAGHHLSGGNVVTCQDEKSQIKASTIASRLPSMMRAS